MAQFRGRLRQRVRSWVVIGAVAGTCAACAAPLQRPARPQPTTPEAPGEPPARRVGRRTVGVAFGGGSARGIAHVGVIRWLEEHRIPIDVAAGTSMGGLVGGAFASGMDAQELHQFLTSLDWDQLFGGSTFAYKNIRRKADARAYPTRLEFGLRGGIVPPTALNSGQAVELLLGRIGAPYYDLTSFDELPTPFRTVAVDLLRARQVVLGRGSLAEAMRATMSLPLIFPPVEFDGQVLIDGGTLNNVPADVVRELGADYVIAINVGDLTELEEISYTLFGVAGSSLDAMLRASTRRAIASADVLINVPVKEFGSLDWRRATDLIEEGYKAADAMRDELLPQALSEADYDAWRRARQARRKTELPQPSYLELDGFASNDERRLEVRLARHVGTTVDVASLEQDLALITGLDRYETVTWSIKRNAAGEPGLLIRGRLKPYAPPFLMLGLNLENTTSSDFRITAAARYLRYDLIGSGSELRVDGTIGSDPSAALALYRPIGPSPLFVEPYAAVGNFTFNFIEEDAIVARYGLTRMRGGLNVGVNFGPTSDLRLGAYVGRTTASIEVGDPEFPEIEGRETGAELVWRTDSQDTPVVPSRGVLSEVRLWRVFNGPDVKIDGETFDVSSRTTRFSATADQFWSLSPNNRVFVYGGFGATLDGEPLPSDQFVLGSPFRLGSYSTGELRGPDYYILTGGYLRQIGRLPDFFGGPIFAGAWLENGDAFDGWSNAGWRTNGGVGVVLDTIVGPVMLAGSWGFDGRWRTYLGIGRIFR
jgi:NTE family protein